MKITIYAHLCKTVKSPKKLDRMAIFYDIEVMAIPRVGEKVMLNGMYEIYNESSLEQDPFYLGDGYEEGATVFEVEHSPFTNGLSVSVEVSEVDSREIIYWFKMANTKCEAQK